MSQFSRDRHSRNVLEAVIPLRTISQVRWQEKQFALVLQTDCGLVARRKHGNNLQFKRNWINIDCLSISMIKFVRLHKTTDPNTSSNDESDAVTDTKGCYGIQSASFLNF